MNQLAPPNADRLSCPQCPDCGVPMRLFGIETHPSIDRTDLLTYVCSQCDEVQTENVPRARPNGRAEGGEPRGARAPVILLEVDFLGE
jgi:hypothetical protein